MLIIREYKEEEGKEILDLLISEKIDDLALTDYIYVAIEDNVMIGACKVELENNNGLLKYLVVKEDNKGEMLGDGILRSLLSKLEKNGIETVYFNDVNPYLLKLGFLKNNDNKLELNLSEFFNSKCKCTEDCGESSK